MIVYTSAYGGRDHYVEPNLSHFDLEVFTDIPMNTQCARVRLDGPSWISDPIRRSRCVKLLPHLWLPPHDVSLWIDASFLWKEANPLTLADLYLKDADMAVVRHYQRNCLYDEADECARLGLDDESLIRDQVSRYETLGFPRHAGLYYTGLLLRRNTPAMRRLNEVWWAEVCRGSRRDQISFPYLIDKLSVKMVVIEATFDFLGFEQRPHLPRP